MGFEWSEDLATGVAEIDYQHKEIFKRINALIDASSHGKGKEAVAETLVFLDDYVKTHFAAEEKIQKEVGYPGYADHMALHRAFLEDISRLKSAFDEKGASLSVTIEVKRIVVDWLINHIKKEDKALAKFMK